MNRTLLFLVILAALLSVGASERDLRGRLGLSSISRNNKDKESDSIFDKVLNFLHLSEGGDGSAGSEGVDEELQGGNQGKGKGDGKGDDNGKGKGDDQDCEVTNWSGWGSCSATCGGGTRSRSCSVKTQPKGKGKKCPNLNDDQPCNTNPCSVSCTFTEWQNWGSCSKSCGTGSQTRNRQVRTGGSSCGPTQDTQPCNTQDCSVDCVMGNWVSWGACDKTCGGGHKRRTRSIRTPASGGGKACEATEDTQDCNTQDCSVDCVMGNWVSWGACDKTCGGGHKRRTRSIRTPASGGGKACEATEDTQDCNTQSCGVDCVMGEWQTWGQCSCTCGGGTKLRTRRVLTPASGGGAPCQATSDTVPCNTQRCY